MSSWSNARVRDGAGLVVSIMPMATDGAPLFSKRVQEEVVAEPAGKRTAVTETATRAAVEAPTADVDGRRDLRWLVRTYGPVLVLAVVVLVISVVARHAMFPAYSWNRDEPVYLWHVEVLRSGQFTATDGGAPMFFRPWLTGAGDGVLFSQYTLGWPLVLLAADVVFGSPGAALAFGALLAVLATYAFAREITADHSLALVAAAVMTASPILAIQGGLYLSYLFTLGLGLLFATGLLSGVRRARPARIVLSGVLLGWIFMTRPFDAVLWGVAVVGYLAFVRRGEWRRLLGAAGWLAAGLVPLVVATFAYNHHVTGSFGEFPITATDPLDTFGFGRRRIMPAGEAVDFGLVEAIRGTAKNGLFLPVFLAGSYLGIVVAGAGLWLRRRERTTLVLLAIGAAFPLGYFFFWGVHLSGGFARFTGPYYYVPLYAPLSILIATVIVAAWRRRRTIAIAVVVVLAVATAPFALNRFDLNQRISQAQAPWKSGTDPIDDRALVFVRDSGPYLLFVNPYSVNDPDLDGRILFAADRGAANLDLIDAMPGRRPYLQQSSVPPFKLLPSNQPPTPVISVTPIEVVRGRTVSLDVEVTNLDGGPTVAVYLAVGGKAEWRTVATDSTMGAVHRTQWQVSPAGEGDGAGNAGDTALTRRLGTVHVGVGSGASVEMARTRPSVRQTFSYRVVGSSVEVLVPGGTDRAVVNDGRRGWVRTGESPELDVAVTSGGG